MHDLALPKEVIEIVIGRVLVHHNQTRSQWRNRISKIGFVRPLQPQMYAALAPAVWTLLNTGREQTNEVLRAVLEHAARLSATSATLPLALEFVSKIILVRVALYFLIYKF